MVSIDLYGGRTPIFSLNHEGNYIFCPFRHSIKFYSKSNDHSHWSFETMDKDEFPESSRVIESWNWIVELDSGYTHSTCIYFLNSVLHGPRIRTLTRKPYRNIDAFSENSLSVNTNHEKFITDIQKEMDEIEYFTHGRIHKTNNVKVSPPGLVSEYIMNCIEYKHRTH